ncbi:hypothetical protein KCP74_02195 [Salmonella enterica subsp. enterica]|nr:hypothetical protein KCP74_02195 [Salmonella enterica subsp. enterica]
MKTVLSRKPARGGRPPTGPAAAGRHRPPIETAIALLKDMGGSSVKYCTFRWGGLTCRDVV